MVPVLLNFLMIQEYFQQLLVFLLLLFASLVNLFHQLNMRSNVHAADCKPVHGEPVINGPLADSHKLQSLISTEVQPAQMHHRPCPLSHKFLIENAAEQLPFLNAKLFIVNVPIILFEILILYPSFRVDGLWDNHAHNLLARP